MKAGAHDFILKGNMTRLVPAIKRGIAQTQAGKPALLEFMTSQETRISKSTPGYQMSA